MNIKYIIRQVILSVLVAVFLIGQSLIILAADKSAAELSVFGQTANGGQPIVKVNGENSVSGRTIFSSSVIETAENSGAVLSIGQLGKIELAANSKFIVSFDEKNINGNLLAGSISVLNSARSIDVKLPDGNSVKLDAGETANANKGLPAKSAAQTKTGGAAWLPWALIVGGAVAALVIATSVGGNDFQLSGNTIVVSPTR